jgi:hypothetical protein
MVETLLRHGADPLLRDNMGRTPLDIVCKQPCSLRNDAEALLIKAIKAVQAERSFLLFKARNHIDVFLATSKLAKARSTAEEGKATNRFSFKVPQYFSKNRKELPSVSLVQPATETPANKKLHAVLTYVLRSDENEESLGMSADVFVEFTEMLAPT